MHSSDPLAYGPVLRSFYWPIILAVPECISVLVNRQQCWEVVAFVRMHHSTGLQLPTLLDPTILAFVASVYMFI